MVSTYPSFLIQKTGLSFQLSICWALIRGSISSNLLSGPQNPLSGSSDHNPFVACHPMSHRFTFLGILYFLGIHVQVRDKVLHLAVTYLTHAHLSGDGTVGKMGLSWTLYFFFTSIQTLFFFPNSTYYYLHGFVQVLSVELDLWLWSYGIRSPLLRHHRTLSIYY